ncbi:MAG TPA: glycosyltransferase family 4 protein, partial [Solirubrobacteraceae bacterium]|nr:glycosyltransferase family 4 protein [Solirubrobacteraceae bacterium]
MHVHVVDPAAYTPPYDHALCAALAATGVDVRLVTSRFVYGPVAQPTGYVREEAFYRWARGPANSRLRRVSKLAEHVPDMLAYRRRAAAADLVHFQWLAVQHVDGLLLPRDRPLVLTAHDVLPREPRPGQLAAQRRLFGHFDAVVVHSAHGARRLVDELGLSRERVHVIPHGVLDHLVDRPSRPLPDELAAVQGPVVLCFGLMRPYKGIDVLLAAWDPAWEAELWIVGMPRMDIAPLVAAAPANVRFVARFVGDDELGAYFRRADVVVLPYREIDQSGVLSTALAFGKALVLSDVGGFAEVGAGALVAPGEPGEL